MPRSGAFRVGWVALLLALGACGGGDDGVTATPTEATTTTVEGAATTREAAAPMPAQEVTSTDGRITVSVPESQIAEPVTVTTSDLDTSFLDPAVEVLGAYELGPDGATFTEPVTVIFDTGIAHEPGDSVPVLLALYGETGSWSAPEVVRVEPTGGSIVMTFDVDHSTHFVAIDDYHRLELIEPVTEAIVGETFDVVVRVAQRTSGGWVGSEHLSNEYLTPRAGGAVEVVGASAASSLAWTFKCVSPDTGTYGFDVSAPHEVVAPSSGPAVLFFGDPTFEVPLTGTATCNAPAPTSTTGCWSPGDLDLAGLLAGIPGSWTWTFTLPAAGVPEGGTLEIGLDGYDDRFTGQVDANGSIVIDVPVLFPGTHTVNSVVYHIDGAAVPGEPNDLGDGYVVLSGGRDPSERPLALMNMIIPGSFQVPDTVTGSGAFDRSVFAAPEGVTLVEKTANTVHLDLHWDPRDPTVTFRGTAESGAVYDLGGGCTVTTGSTRDFEGIPDGDQLAATGTHTHDATFEISGCPGLEPTEVPATGTWQITFDPSGVFTGEFLEDGVVVPFRGSLDLTQAGTCGSE